MWLTKKMMQGIKDVIDYRLERYVGIMESDIRALQKRVGRLECPHSESRIMIEPYGNCPMEVCDNCNKVIRHLGPGEFEEAILKERKGNLARAKEAVAPAEKNLKQATPKKTRKPQ